MQKTRFFLRLDRKLLKLNLAILRVFLRVSLIFLASFIAQCSNSAYLMVASLHRRPAPRKIIRDDGYQTNLGVTVLGEILEVASFVATLSVLSWR